MNARAEAHAVWLLRHGDTEWTEQGRHTGVREVPLSDKGRRQARRAGRALDVRRFARVLVSHQLRARETCQLAGFYDGSVECRDLAEWDYGEYEGLTDSETERRRPGWDLFSDGAPGGESPVEIERRVDRIFTTLEEQPHPCLLVSHGKLLRALAARWIGCAVALGRNLPMDPASIGVLDREGEVPLIRLWNYTGDIPPTSRRRDQRRSQSRALLRDS